LLQRMEAGGRGRVETTFGHATTALFLNTTDPAREVDGERSHLSTQHPLWSDPRLRRAFALCIDRASIQKLFGRQAVVTGNWVNNPARYRSPDVNTEFSVEKARQLLDAAGWVPGPDGVRVKGGRRLALLFHGAANPIIEKYMVVVKANAERAGFAVDLKVSTPSMFFSSDVASPDTLGKFLSDVTTSNLSSFLPDPAGMASVFLGSRAATRANKWIGSNIVRWRNAEYDALYDASMSELDPVKRTAMFVRMNALLAEGGHVIPLVSRSAVRVVASNLRLPLSAWRHDTASLCDWYREA
jgi:peptide/nickel transport system substrate-binding protein